MSHVSGLGAIKLSEEQTALVDEAVASGEYASQEAVVAEALREWKERRDNFGYTLTELRHLVQDGADSGPGRLSSMDEVKTEARRRLGAR